MNNLEVTKRLIILLLVGIFFVSFSGGVSAACQNMGEGLWQADTCNQQDVQECIDSAVDGDTVRIPAGECEWDGIPDVSISGKGITIQGAGADMGGTVIINTKPFLEYDGMFEIRSDDSHEIRVTGIWFKGSTTNVGAVSHINVIGISTDAIVRIDNCKFSEGYMNDNWVLGSAIVISGPYAIVNNCTFDTAGKETIQVTGESEHWTNPTNVGTDNSIFVENNVFINNYVNPTGAHHIIAGFGGARYVLRYNDVHNGNIDAHGFCGNIKGSTRWYEIYENNLYIDSSFSQTDFMFLRGGSGVVYNNNIINDGSLNYDIRLTNYRSDEDWCNAATIRGASYEKCACNTINNPGEGYPSYDQIGRGQNQDSEPLYIWGNNFLGNQRSFTNIGVVDLGGSCDDECGVVQNMADWIQQNRDYNLIEKPGYTPYTYPHPLTYPTCGDWIIEGSEECDDGNTASEDGCSSLCMNEEGSGTCQSGADSDTSGDVSLSELMSYIGDWKSGTVTLGDLMIGIGEWKNGC
ncbi:MAG: myxococcus cysteine-rich repeat containing protein [archaeon]